jgi:murein DD-endopeptidase MepM/ murein hydrolase activator NlpD
MKLYHIYKKYIGFFILGILLLIPVVFLRAQTAADIQNKINQNNSNIQSLEEEIAAYQTQLDALGQQKSSLAISLKELDLNNKKLSASIAVTQNKINKTNLTIQNLSSDINNKENSIQNDIDSIKLEIKNTNELEQNSLLENILSQNDFASIWNDLDNLTTVREKLRVNVINLKQIKGELEDTRTQTLAAKAQLTELKSELSDQQKIVIQNVNEKNQLLKQTKNSEANYQKLLKNRIAQKNAFEKEINDYEAQLKFILDPSKLPPAGVLSWPLQKIFVTQLFGKTIDSKRLYVSGTHNGVDFRASIGTPVMSMADGVVLGTGNTDLTCPGASYGKFVFIQYNDGLSSTFGHLSLITTQAGQQVKRGEIVGYSGDTGYVTGPHLHVSLYASGAVKMATKPSAACSGHTYTLPVSPVNAYLNALDYLPPYTINSSILNNQPTE